MNVHYPSQNTAQGRYYRIPSAGVSFRRIDHQFVNAHDTARAIKAELLDTI